MLSYLPSSVDLLLVIALRREVVLRLRLISSKLIKHRRYEEISTWTYIGWGAVLLLVHDLVEASNSISIVAASLALSFTVFLCAFSATIFPVMLLAIIQQSNIYIYQAQRQE